MTRDTLTVALPKGRLLDPCVEMFRNLGCTELDEVNGSRRLFWEAPAQGLRFLVVKAGDVPVYVKHGAADLGIVGQDVLYEAQHDVYEPLCLGFGHCRLVVAAPAGQQDVNLRRLSHVRVATKYPHLTRDYFLKRGVSVEIVTLAGSVELAPQVGIADLITDMVETGRTLRENGLVEMDTVLHSEACLIVNRASHKLKLAAVSELLGHIREVRGITNERDLYGGGDQ